MRTPSCPGMSPSGRFRGSIHRRLCHRILSEPAQALPIITTMRPVPCDHRQPGQPRQLGMHDSNIEHQALRANVALMEASETDEQIATDHNDR